MRRCADPRLEMRIGWRDGRSLHRRGCVSGIALVDTRARPTRVSGQGVHLYKETSSEDEWENGPDHVIRLASPGDS
jgi:hypothetical protein